ncbi:DMT family transporter [Spongorhabdus nitratireducens]
MVRPQIPLETRGVLLALIGALFLTPDALLVRLTGTDDLTTLFWRGGIIALTLLAMLVLQHRSLNPRLYLPNQPKAWLGALIFSVSLSCFVLAVTHTTVANVLVILSTNSLFAALLSMFFLKEHVPPRTWIAIVLALSGILLIFSDDMDSSGMLGKLFALGCTLCTAAGIVLVRHTQTINTPAMFAWGGILVAFVSALQASVFAVSPSQVVRLVAMGSMNGFAFVLLAAGARLIPAAEVTLLMLLETILGPVWVWLVLHEEPSFHALLGGGIIVLTLFIHTVVSLKQAPDTEVQPEA